MREKVVDELAKVHRSDIIEIKFIDACRFDNISRKRISENRVFATYKRKVGEYYGTLVDMMYGEAYVILIVGQTNGKVDIVSVPERNIQKVARLRRNAPTIKTISHVGDSMLGGSRDSRFKTSKKGIGEKVGGTEEDAEDTEW